MFKLSVLKRLRPNILLVPKTVLYVGIYSMMLNLSSAVVYANIGLLLTKNVGINSAQFGIFESIVTFLGYSARFICGWVSDYIKNRKIVIIIGCIAVMSSNILLAYSASMLFAIFTRCLGRLGHGLQSVSRALLINDVTDTRNKGIAYGISRSLGTFGSLVGTLGLYIFTEKFTYSIDVTKLVFFMSIPPLIAAIFVAKKIEEPKTNVSTNNSAHNNRTDKPSHNIFSGIYRLGGKFWLFMVVSILFSSVCVSDVLVMTAAVKKYNTTENAVNLMSTLMSSSAVIAGYICGYLSERIGKYRILLIVFFLKFIAQCWIGQDVEYHSFLCALCISGIPMIVLQNIPESIVADLAPKEHSGIAFGIYYSLIALSIGLGSSVFGKLLMHHGMPEAMHMLSHVSFIVLCLLVLFEMFGFLRNTNKN